MPFAMTDKQLYNSTALPNGAAAVSSTAFDLGLGDHLAQVEFKISAPILTTTEQPDAKTMIYKIEHSDDNSSFSTLFAAVITQTGAGGAGAAAAIFATRLPVDVKRYVRATATGSATGNSSTKSMITELKS